MVDHDGRVVDTATLLDRGELSDIVLMKLANVPKPKSAVLTREDVDDYHKAIAKGDITVYVADVETIFRVGFPLGSSTFEKIFRFVGMADAYAQLATYDETAAALSEIRDLIDTNGMNHYPGLEAFLRSAGLNLVPNPGYMLRSPVTDFTTKFDVAGDKPLNYDEARDNMHITADEFSWWLDTVSSCSRHQIKFDETRGIINMDGKAEAAIARGRALFTDFFNTPDENRLMVEYKCDDITYLIPSNKEIQRAIFRARGISSAIGSAKEMHGDGWRTHLMEFTSEQDIRDAAADSCEMMADAVKHVGNLILGKQIFDARPLQSWVDGFLPYASRKNYKQIN
jgi:hypothetical protein